MTISPQVFEADTRWLPLSETRVLLGVGLAIALITDLVSHVAGQLVLVPPRLLVTAAVSALTVPVMWAPTAGTFRWRGLSSGARREAAVLLIAPDMPVDAVSAALFSVVYPSTGLEAAGFFGGLLLLAYMTVLVAGSVNR